MKLIFNKVRPPKQIDFKTRYYDAKKEAEEKRKQEIEDRINNPGRIDIREEMRKKWGHEDRYQSKSRKYALYVYAIILAILLYIILK
ncbi:MAG TPA: hypothetical protein DCG69_05450 [Bacteroidales bacterium]|nr:hypothetical protein [Bacteroidales bacterium]